MDSPLKRVVLISGLVIFALIACVYPNIIGSADNDRCINLLAQAYVADAPGAGDQSHPWRSEFPKFNRRLDGYEFIVGVLLTSLGLIAIVLGCLRWNTKDLSLLSFGAFCLLWGARTNLFRPGIRLSTEIRILRVGFVIYALFAIHANVAYHIFNGTLAQDIEPVGLRILFCCLGYLVARRFFQNQKDLISLENELETARQIQSFILPRKMAKIKGLKITARYIPMDTMAGDFYDFLVIDRSRIGILVADVSGHGVPAALIASMVKIAFVSQTPHAFDPARVLKGVNRTLCGKLESDFENAAT